MQVPGSVVAHVRAPSAGAWHGAHLPSGQSIASHPQVCLRGAADRRTHRTTGRGTGPTDRSHTRPIPSGCDRCCTAPVDLAGLWTAQRTVGSGGLRSPTGGLRPAPVVQGWARFAGDERRSRVHARPRAGHQPGCSRTPGCSESGHRAGRADGARTPATTVPGERMGPEHRRPPCQASEWGPSAGACVGLERRHRGRRTDRPELRTRSAGRGLRAGRGGGRGTAQRRRRRRCGGRRRPTSS